MDDCFCLLGFERCGQHRADELDINMQLIGIRTLWLNLAKPIQSDLG